MRSASRRSRQPGQITMVGQLATEVVVSGTSLQPFQAWSPSNQSAANIDCDRIEDPSRPISSFPTDSDARRWEFLHDDILHNAFCSLQAGIGDVAVHAQASELCC